MQKVSVKQENQCWEWNGARSGSGYGQFWDGTRNIPAHWFLLDSHPSKGMEACHKCDNKLCVKPSHIFIGSRSDNMKDMVNKNRHNTKPGCLAMLKVRKVKNGQNNHECKLTEEQAIIAKGCPLKKGTASILARKFGVSLTVICDIRKGKRWSHLEISEFDARQRAEAFLKTLGKWKEVQK
jgi:hypothetical protein